VIVAGLISCLLFVLTLVAVVKYVIA
jgi:hypothetical protein